MALELGELHHRVHALRYRCGWKAKRGREQGDVLAAGQLGWKPWPTASSGSTRPQTRISSRRHDRAGQDLEKGGLSGPVEPDDANRLAAVEGEVDAARASKVTFAARRRSRLATVCWRLRCSPSW